MAEDANANIRVDIDTAAALASIKNLQRQISAFHTNMAKGGAAAAATSLNLQQGLLNSINRTGQFSATIKNVKSTTESFTNALEKNKLSMREYFRYSGAATKTFGRFFRTEFDTINKVARERVKDLQTQYIKMGRDANGAIRSIAVRPLALDMENLGTRTQIAAQRQALLNQMLKQGSTNLLNFGKNTQWAGRQLMVGFTIPLVMFGTVASKTFMDMEKQAIRFKRVYGELFTTTAETTKALEEIKQLANEFTRYGIAVSKTMELAADIAATGKMGAELTAQVAESTRLAVLGGVEQAEALKATISLTDAFGVSAEDLAGKIDFLNAVENQTVTSIEDLTIAIPKAGPVVQQLGGDVQDLTFFLTAMREGGINASEGANALKSGLASMINPTGKAAEMLQGFGINLKGIVDANKGNVKGIVIDFAKALDTLDPLNRAQAIEQLFGKFQFARLSTLFQNVIKEGNQASRVLKLANATTAELAILSERELKKVEDSPMFKFQKAVEDIKVTLVPLGEAFLKAVTPVLEFGTKILEKFNELDSGAKQFVVGLTAIAGVIGPIFLMGFGLIANGVANVIKGFVFFKTAMNKAATSSTQLGVQTEYMTQQQLEAAAVASSLNQVHQTLRQTFTSEASAVDALTAAYRRSLAAQTAMSGGVIGRTRTPKKYASGVISVPGPRGAGDVVPAMLSPGEAVIPAKQSKKYRGLISSLISDNVPGFRFGRNPFASMLGRSNVGVRMQSQTFSQALSSGSRKYQSGFATGTGDDFVSKYGLKKPKQKQLRINSEQRLFGLSSSTPGGKRPTYGFASSSPFQSILNTLLFGKAGARASAAMNPRSSKLDRYGDISLITKGSVAKRSTAYAGDSLLDYSRNKNFSGSTAPMRGATKDQLQSAQFGRFGQPFGSIQTGKNSFTTNPKPPYVETHTPGGFSFKEIDRIIARDPVIANQLKTELRAAGLGAVRVVGSGFVARLFKKIGVPGYKDGIESVPGSGKKTAGIQMGSGTFSDAPNWTFDSARPGGFKRGTPESDKWIAQNLGLTPTGEPLPKQSTKPSKKTTKPPKKTISVAKNIPNVSGPASKPDFAHYGPGKLAPASAVLADKNLALPPSLRNIIGQLDRVVPNAPVSLKNSWGGAMDPKANRLLATGKASVDLISDQFSPKQGVAARYGEMAKLTGSDISNPQLQKELKAYDSEMTKRLKNLKAVGITQVIDTEKQWQVLPDKQRLVTRSLESLDKEIIRDIGSTNKNLVAARDKALGVVRDVRISEGLTKAERQKILDDPEASKALSRRVSSKSEERRIWISRQKKSAGGFGSMSNEKANVKNTKATEKETKAKTSATKAKEAETKAVVKNTKATKTQTGTTIKTAKTQKATNTKAVPQPQEAATQPKRRTPGMGLGVAGMVATGAVMGGSMMPGEVGKISQDLMMPIMMLSMIAPMLKNPVVLAIAAVAGLAAGIYFLNKALSEATKKGAAAAKAMTMTGDKLQAMSEFVGTVSASEIANKDRADLLSGGSEGQRKFGQSYLESEAGATMLSDITAMAESGMGSGEIGKNLSRQLGYAIMQGVITQDQAKSIASALGEKLGDYSIPAKISGDLVALFGKNGENLLNDPLKIAIEIQKDSMASVEEAFKIGQEGFAKNVKTDIFGSTSYLGRVAQNLLLIPATIDAYNDAMQNKELTGASLTLASEQLTQNKGLVDSLKAQYDQKIAIKQKELESAKTAKDRKQIEQDINDLLLDRNADVQALKDANAQSFDSLMNLSLGLDKGTFDEGFKTAAAGIYTEGTDKIFGDQAIKAIDGLDNKREFQVMLSLGYMSKELHPNVINAIVAADEENNGEISTTFTTLLKTKGTAEANDAMLLLAQSNVDKANYDVFLNMFSQKDRDFDKSFEAMSRIVNFAGKYGYTLDLNVNGEEQIDNLQSYMDSTKDFPETVTLEYLTNFADTTTDPVLGAQLRAMIDNWDVISGGDNKAKYSVTMDFIAGQNDPGVKAAYMAEKGIPGAMGFMVDDGEAAAWAIAEAGGDGGDSDKPDPNKKNNGTGNNTNPYNNINKDLKELRNNAVNATGGIKELMKWLGKGKDMRLFKGTMNALVAGGTTEEFQSFVSGLDKNAQRDLFKISDGVAKLTGKGKALQKTFNEISLGKFVIDQQRAVANSKNQKIAAERLIAAGMAASDAYSAVEDSAFAAGIATMKLGKKGREELKTIVNSAKEAEKAIREVSPESLASFLKESIDSATERVEINFEFSVSGDMSVIRTAESDIAALQFKIDDFQAGLQEISWKEDAINEKYDKRADALDKVRRINSEISDQQRGQLSLAEAITRGDLSAAAQAVQNIRQTQAEQAFERQTSALESAREKELGAVRSSKGRSRLQLEEDILKTEKEIFAVEEDRLEPARDRVRILEDERTKALESLKLQGLRYDDLVNKINSAKFSTKEYATELAAALATLQKMAGIQLPGEVAGERPGPEKDGSFVGQLGPQGNFVWDGKAWVKIGSETGKNILTPNPEFKPTPGNTRPGPEKPGDKPGQVGPGGQFIWNGVQWVKRAMGGKIMANYSNGGSPLGSDIVPAMLTPGEFVIRRPMVKKFGPKFFEQLNNGMIPSFNNPSFKGTAGNYGVDSAPVNINAPSILDNSSVYNYNLSVNVSSVSDPNAIAQTVMGQIRRIESQRIRSNRF